MLNKLRVQHFPQNSLLNGAFGRLQNGFTQRLRMTPSLIAAAATAGQLAQQSCDQTLDQMRAEVIAIIGSLELDPLTVRTIHLTSSHKQRQTDQGDQQAK